MAESIQAVSAVGEVMNDVLSKFEFIKFDPEKLREAAGQLETQCGKLEEKTTSIKKRAESLTNSWHGDAADEYIKKSRELDEEAQKLHAILNELIRKLHEASGVYQEGAKNAKTTAESLPTSGVFQA